MAVQDENVQMVRLASIDKMDTVAVIGSLPATIPAAEFAIPEKGIDELTKEIEDSQKQIAECDEVFKKAAVYESSFQVQMLKPRMRRIIHLQARPQKAMRILYGSPDIFRKRIFRDSKQLRRKMAGHGRRKM